MVCYHRHFVPGGTFFFILTLAVRGSDLLMRHIALLPEAFRTALRERSFHIDAIVVLPDHLHAIWTLPPGDVDLPRPLAARQASIAWTKRSGVPEKFVVL
jgi:putative transposase